MENRVKVTAVGNVTYMGTMYSDGTTFQADEATANWLLSIGSAKKVQEAPTVAPKVQKEKEKDKPEV